MLVAIFGAPLIIFLIIKGGWPFVALVLLINLVAQYEFFAKSDEGPRLDANMLYRTT